MQHCLHYSTEKKTKDDNEYTYLKMAKIYIKMENVS